MCLAAARKATLLGPGREGQCLASVGAGQNWEAILQVIVSV